MTTASAPRPWCECDPDYDGRCPYPCQIDAGEKREAASATSTCPRCEGQKYDRGSCELCGNLGFLCPVCAARMTRTPIYSGGRSVYRCTECEALVVDDEQEPVSPGKLVSLRRPA